VADTSQPPSIVADTNQPPSIYTCLTGQSSKGRPRKIPRSLRIHKCFMLRSFDFRK